MRGRAAEYEQRYQQARSLVMREKREAKQVALEVGISLYPFIRRLRREEGLDVRSKRKGNQKPDPTPEELQQRADAIKASWSEEEASRRWVACHSSIRADRLSRMSRSA
jgi:hypothetical protein